MNVVYRDETITWNAVRERWEWKTFRSADMSKVKQAIDQSRQPACGLKALIDHNEKVVEVTVVGPRYPTRKRRKFCGLYVNVESKETGEISVYSAILYESTPQNRLALKKKIALSKQIEKIEVQRDNVALKLTILEIK